MFAEATRRKLRWSTDVGNMSVEHLWELPLTGKKVNLDDLAKALNKEIKENAEESFVNKKSTANKVLELKFNIVKHIIEYRLNEQDARKGQRERKKRKDAIMAIIADKETEDLKDKSIEDLKKELESL